MSSILRALVGAATVLAVSHAAPLAAQSAAPQRFAYVDTKSILDQAPGRVEAEAQLQKEAVAWDAEVKKMQDANIALVTEFQKNSATMTATQRDQRTKAITDKQAEWQKRNDEINSEADRRKAELLQPILDQVKIALEDVRKAANLDVIFDVAQNASIVAVDKNLNISDRVIARLRLLGAPVVTKADTKAATPSSTKPSGLPVSAPSGIGRPAPIKPDSGAVPKKPDTAPVE